MGMPSESGTKIDSVQQAKPPLGLTPEWLFELHKQHDRLMNISDAITRYSQQGVPIPIEWAKELERRLIAYQKLVMNKRSE